eukprot:gnl/TRDRNA2_/TRDRNA2_170466_c1_seq2.p1 gnl/TRDRNA2_/TRDRNA2_170466_c1~~gnl/TRDRNA2_/TRDRNA2_170466_c1_seq2.p1  ORF type:complete len:279 (-),score=74.74 gnl/TRDRNA2_/TRDRNA2_170466_c1_seq2:202-990(-)
MFYEAGGTVACSGVLAAKPDGTVVHGRNLDLGTQDNPLEHSEIIFSKGGKPLYMVAASASGDIGMATGLRYKDENGDGWSFEQNTRHPDPQQKGIFSAFNTMASKAGGVPYGWAARRIMEETPDFKTAVQKFEHTKFSAPSYFILAGAKPWEGAIINADRASDKNEAMNNVQVLSPAIGRWFIAQFNYDNTKVAEDGRRDTLNGLMLKMGQEGVGEESIMRVMKAPGVFSDGTHITFVSTPAENSHVLLDHYEPVEAALVAL